MTTFRKFKDIKAVVAGATGGVGKAIVQRLVREGVPVVALARSTLKAVRNSKHAVMLQSCSIWIWYSSS